MRSGRPPLTSLRVFEVVARHGSFSRAARELNVTASAVSHQVRVLEEYLGVALFERRARSIGLTRHAELVFPGLRAGFAMIDDALALLAADRGRAALVISAPPGFSAKWLMPRLYRFAEANPGLDVRIVPTNALANFGPDGVDIAVRTLRSPYPPDDALLSEELVGAELAPVCSPVLLERYGDPKRADVFARIPIIHDDSIWQVAGIPGWDDYLRAAGLDGHGSPTERGIHFGSSDFALEAAAQGAGLVFTHTLLSGDDVATGRLVRPFAQTVPANRSYYLVAPRSSAKRPLLERFRSWLFTELGQAAE
ncbi:MAG: LysR substrate-binding domain-containing protein [Burkholderiaceae bacterium]